ncbi:flagellar filament capping protein FliD [Blastococcus atacamensis]|uniref:flagellar filament capping protein FliD n=1 Tax=Blastococcus atacamensis TaxID=2070508 RepID=UPI000CEC216A|nr:flagellar filament capping protein FliD [Blastococcus atacamensis]
MAGMNVGLVSGMDTASLIDQLIQVEANPQKLLRNKLLDTQADAKAYRAVNTKFDALRTAAEALTKTATWAAATATSSSAGVAATASPGATAGSVTFTVQSLASSHSVLSDKSWGATTDTYDLTLPLVVDNLDGTTKAISLDDGATLADVVSAINTQATGLTATAVKTTTGYRLQVGSAATGAASDFDLGTGFQVMSKGADAKLSVGTSTVGYEATSPTNTFTDVLAGTTFTVSEKAGPVTVSVTSNPEAVATAVETLVKAANDVLSSIKTYTDSNGGSAAVLKGDNTLRSLSGKVLQAVSDAIGEESAAKAGLQLDRYGAITFTSETFLATLKSTPEVAQRLVNGTGSGTTAVPGVAQRLLTLAKDATNSTTGALSLRAKSQDNLAKDLEIRIEDWDRRLELRRANLTAQFTAMESALGTLQNKSSWLSAQLSQLAPPSKD